MTKKAIFIFAILATAQSARADYHYASHEGSDEYPYTSWETGAQLIQDAVDAAEPGDTIYIDSGDWHETIGMQEEDSLMALIGMGMDNTRIYWDVSRRAVIYNATKTLLKDLHTDHTTGWCNVYSLQDRELKILDCRFSGSMVQTFRGNLIVENCIFEDVFAAVHHNWGGNLTVKNCIINGSYSSAVRTEESVSTIQNNIFINMRSYAIWFSHYPDSSLTENNLVYNTRPWLDGGIAYGGDDYSITRNNTLYLNQNWRFYDGFISNDRGAQYINNTVIRAYQGFHIFEDTVIINYNNLWDNVIDYYVSPSGFIDTTGNIYCDPMFEDTLDFRLQAFSPLIDAGDPEILDVDGTRSDIGCYGGPGGCSYTYLDLAPLIPDSITVEVEEQLITLNWRFNTEADFNRYQVFRDTVSGFTPSEFNMIAERDTSYYEDQDIEPGTAYYYRLTSVDNQGNVSDYSDEVGFIPTDVLSSPGDGLPRYTVIESAYPNPFNSDITIVYSASNLGPQPPEIKLQIFDIQGRVVKTLIDERIPMGTYRAIWDGTNERGEQVSSGTYIAKVFQWGMDAGDFPVKITLIK